MTLIDPKRPVAVTGATGYVAGWLVKKLLDEGFTVHAPIRNPESKEKTQYLDSLAAQAPGTIRYFKADLLQEGSYDKALEACELVYHTASPFTVGTENPKEELLDPAIRGTRNVLESVNRTPSVKRVVLTSSCAAIYGDTIDLQEVEDETLTEDHWNTSSSLHHQPYSYSKTMAEKEAWRIAEAQERWDLVVVNPSLVLGPAINPKASSESFNILRQIADGTMKLGAPEYYIGTVDVRDVAEAHYRAGLLPTSSGRHIVSAQTESFLSLAGYLQDEFGDRYDFPRRLLPKWLVWLFGPLNGFSRKMVSRNLGYYWKADNSKSREKLGITYRPIKQSVNEMFRQMDSNQLI